MLAVRFRTAAGDRLLIGPMTYLESGLGSRKLALVYAAVAGVAALTTTPFTQPNSVAVVFESELGVPTWVTGVAMMILVFMVVIGGVKSIGRVAAKLAPTIVTLYLLGGLVVILRLRRAHPGGARHGLQRSLLVRRRGRRRDRRRHDGRHALRHRPRHLRQRGGLRHRRGRLRQRRLRTARPAGVECHGRSGHRVVRDFERFGAHHPALGCLAVGRQEHDGSGDGVRLGDSVRQLLRPALRAPLRLLDVDRLGLLRRAVPHLPRRSRG